ncbi:MAG: hypothetical protein DRP59_03715 [Spirochaetes bacterium]|nr:MAG: hypothetical protein DRP59_03715 [Spirochaetota bacterium]
MIIWIDSDSCPVKIREIVIRAANRVGINAVFVANREIPGVESNNSSLIVVEKGEGVADAYIVARASEGDLAITRDIPLAADLVAKGVLVLDDRGSVMDSSNIRERLSMRNAMTELRSYGIVSETTKPMSQRDIQQFAAAFDKQLRQWINNAGK